MQLMELKEILQKKLSAPNIRTSKEEEKAARIRRKCKFLSAVPTDTRLRKLATVDSPCILAQRILFS
jgi:hypothetical protein